MKLQIYSLPSFDKEQLPFFNNILSRIIHTINALEIGDGTTAENMSCEYKSITTPATANIEFSLSHTLKRIPHDVRFITKGKAQAAILYDSGTAWTSAAVYLKCNTVSASGTVIIY